ncbi:hypothetical protein [Mucilaginibacter myungsuensis]|uniref:Uncharacterized protein n=1 Tax=Mucilaginibacter myungsuensis TaxID=649104 RepID=A0A929L0T6_9SPHI|nr:hypothetical protein [Mucilaginibacter myungsuensis]MBE9663488.1 hypothetical protein [Mucilaginibacter myungsuensis]MDN3600226.1 hypothetical protein [Mucilaginibacter myungsuensis]
MDLSITNIEELQAEIARLEGVKVVQQKALGERFNGPGAIFNAVLSIFPKSAATDAVKKQDLLGIVSRFVLPLALNKTLFRNSNFIVKTLVGLASQKASHYISEDNVTGVWGKVSNFIGKFTKKKDKKPLPPKDLTGFGIEKIED